MSNYIYKYFVKFYKKYTIFLKSYDIISLKATKNKGERNKE